MINVILGDITTLDVQAIVNAANERLLAGGGVCAAIHEKAGPELALACAKIGHCGTGQAVITPGFNMPQMIIHAVGPMYGIRNADELLARVYVSSLEIARAHGISSVAFPCISTGIYRYPVKAAALIAAEAVYSYFEETDDAIDVTFCCFSQSDFEIYSIAADFVGLHRTTIKKGSGKEFGD